MRKPAALVLAVLVSLSLASCASGQASSSSESSSEPAPPQTNGLTAVILPDDSYPNALLAKGAGDCAKENNYEIEYYYTNGSRTAEDKAISDAMESGANVIICLPLEPDASMASLRRAYDGSVKMIALINAPDSSDFLVTGLYFNNYELAELAGMSASAYITENFQSSKARFAVVQYGNTPENSEYIYGFLDQLEATEKAVAADIIDLSESEDAPAAIAAMISNSKSAGGIDIIFATSAEAAEAVQKGLEALELGEDAPLVYSVGTGTDNQAGALLTAEKTLVTGIAVPDYYGMGETAMEAAISSITCGACPTGGYFKTPVAGAYLTPADSTLIERYLRNIDD